jgi:large subunit ribosomal protein L6
MSRIGKEPIQIPKDATVQIAESNVTTRGAKGEMLFILPKGVNIIRNEDILNISTSLKGKKADAIHGLVRATIANNITGVTKGWTRILELTGVGYRAVVNGVSLVLTIGFSHQVTVEPPKGIAFTIQDGKIVVSGFDKQLVGQVAAKIREIKKPEPYKGKGIKYLGEHIRRKAGKAAKAVGGATSK